LRVAVSKEPFQPSVIETFDHQLIVNRQLTVVNYN
jgi:hypothetical protein